MADFPQTDAAATPLHISTASLYSASITQRWASAAITVGNATTWVANLAAYVPISIPFSYPVRRVFWFNGTTITSTNVQMGIYTSEGVKLFATASVAQAGAGAFQYSSLATPLLLPAGSYYLAWTCNNTTARGATQTSTAAQGRVAGLLQQASALPLPATATFAAWAQAFGAPFMGITRTSTGF